MKTNYTEQCPLCQCEDVEELFDWWLPSSKNPEDTYFCIFCRSEWKVLDDGADYKVIQDNTDSIPLSSELEVKWRY